MRLMELLESFGGRIGILAKAENNHAQPASKIQTRSVTLEELSSEIRAHEVKALADAPADLTAPFEKIMAAAGITPGPQGWTIDRLHELLLTAEFKNKPRADVQRRILTVLAAEKVGVEDLVKDAIARDRAMDAFEATARRNMEGRAAARERQAAEINKKIGELEQEKAKLKEQTGAEQSRWKEWRKEKRGRERDLAWTVGFLIDQQVITTDDRED